MQFHIEHTTEFVYPEPATEAFSEIRLRPRDTLHQTISHHQTRVTPSVLVENYTDYFGNYVETVSVPFRHQRLSVTSICDVVTECHPDPLGNLSLTVCEARLLYKSRLRELHDFIRPSKLITFSEGVRTLSDQLMPDTADFTASLRELNRHIFERFSYTPGATGVTTSVEEVVSRKEGVCQDFAHLMIAVCRMAGFPARYVSGYIETDPAPEGALVGATASHAWVEILSPNGFWVSFDPTNNIMESERHVQIGVGRDYSDVPPMKGTFKGTQRQILTVDVRVRRGGPEPTPVPLARSSQNRTANSSPTRENLHS